MLRLAATALAVAMVLSGCDPDGGGVVVTAGDTRRGDQGLNGGGDTDGLAPYNQVTFTHEIVNVDSTAKPAGIQGVLQHAPDGTAYFAFLKFVSSTTTSCDIAVFGGGPAPSANHELRIGVKGPSDVDWTVETVPLANVGPPDYAITRFGLSGVINGAGQPIISLAAGGPGLFTCGSSDLVLAERTGANNYSLTVPSADSSDCCTIGTECPPQSACRNGEDVGAWSALAFDGSGNLAAIHVDHHNLGVEDGNSWPGLEFWHETQGISGIEPWSGTGLYGDLVYAQDGKALTAVTHFKDRGLFVYRQMATTGSVDDWTMTDLRPGSAIGERIQLAVATDGTVGLAFHEKVRRFNAVDENVDDLIYCESNDHGETWTLPCTNVGQAIVNLGHNPSLVFDSANRPVIAYRYCGPAGSCPASNDSVRLTWRDDDGVWRHKVAVDDAGSREGIYVTLSLDPSTDEPLIGYQNLTTGAAMVARGSFD